jgi:hypothetical protein
VAQEAVGSDLELERVAATVPGRREDGSAEDPVLRLRGREGAEVVLAEDDVRGVRELLLVERARQPPAAAELERRGCALLNENTGSLMAKPASFFSNSNSVSLLTPIITRVAMFRYGMP